MDAILHAFHLRKIDQLACVQVDARLTTALNHVKKAVLGSLPKRHSDPHAGALSHKTHDLLDRSLAPFRLNDLQLVASQSDQNKIGIVTPDHLLQLTVPRPVCEIARVGMPEHQTHPLFLEPSSKRQSAGPCKAIPHVTYLRPSRNWKRRVLRGHSTFILSECRFWEI